MSDDRYQTLVGHLSELRFRLVRCLWGVVVGFIICYNLQYDIFDILRAPIQPYLPAGGLVFTGPMDKFISHLKIAFFGGVILACPWWIYQAWKFIAPGLYQKEKRIASTFIFAGTILFLTGIVFTYFVVLPMAFKFLMTYGGDVDKPMITIDAYLSFVILTALAFGAAFELPLIIVTLAMFGIVDQAFLKRNRRYAIVGIAAISAIITPPDLLSMILLLVPMCFLFEMSIFVVGVLERKKTASQSETPISPS